MKSLLLLFLALLLVGGVLAIDTPMPITGKLAGFPAGTQVMVKNDRTGVSVPASLTRTGDFLVEWANTPAVPSGKLRSGDTFSFTVAGCANCAQSAQYNGQAELHVNLAGTNDTGIGTPAKAGIGLGIAAIIGGIIYQRRKAPAPVKAKKAKKR